MGTVFFGKINKVDNLGNLIYIPNYGEIASFVIILINSSRLEPRSSRSRLSLWKSLAGGINPSKKGGLKPLHPKHLRNRVLLKRISTDEFSSYRCMAPSKEKTQAIIGLYRRDGPGSVFDWLGFSLVAVKHCRR